MSSKVPFRSALLLAAIAMWPAAPLAADADAGRETAQKWCAQCHLVDVRQERGIDGVPTFRSIGANPVWNEASLTARLAAPHPVMPNFSLTRTATADLLAFIRQQAK